MDSVKNAANYVGDKVNEATSGASKEANKSMFSHLLSASHALR